MAAFAKTTLETIFAWHRLVGKFVAYLFESRRA
jgi:hypothetical protein